MFTCVGNGCSVSTLQQVKCDKFLAEGFWKYFYDSKVTICISLSYFTCFYMKLTYHEARELETFLRAENGSSVRMEQLVWKRWWWPVRWGRAWVGLWVAEGRQYPGVTQHPSVTLFWALGTRRKMIPRCSQVSRDVQPRSLRKAAQLSALLSARAPIVGRGGRGDTTRKVAAYTDKKKNVMTNQGWDIVMTKGRTGGLSGGVGMKGYQRMIPGVKV